MFYEEDRVKSNKILLATNRIANNYNKYKK